jgi:hypothetical protein
MSDKQCDCVTCDFRPSRVRKILSVIDVAKVTHIDPIEIARTVLNPRGERTMGRIGIDISNPEEDATCEVVAVQAALKALGPDATTEMICKYICPWSIPPENPNEVRDPETLRPQRTEEHVRTECR